MIKRTTCRVCKAALFDSPIFSLSNMPSSAQGFGETRDHSLALFPGVNLEVCQCSRCELVQLNNSPVPYYKDVIRAAAFSDEMKKFRESQFAKFVELHSLRGKKVLEAGCGKGEYLQIMKDSGAHAYGIEHESGSVAECTASGLQVEQLYVDRNDIKIPNGPFDAFFTMNFFEHAPHPSSMLQGLRSNLTDNGVGLIEVPNFDMMLKNNQFSEFIGDHLLYFTEKTLTSTLDMNGFEVLDCKSIWYDYIISAVVRKTDLNIQQPLDLSGFSSQKDNVVASLHEYIERYSPQQVAIYGAGHQALAVLSIAGLGYRVGTGSVYGNGVAKIKYIVDDATFKQGKFAPGSHLPIVTPKKLETDPVEAIIVMAASYSDEVVSRIQSAGYNNIGLAVLRQDGLQVIN